MEREINKEQRIKQILEASTEYVKERGYYTGQLDVAFIDGAEWADEHSKEYSVSEELEEAAEHLSKIYAEEGSIDPKRESFAFYIGFKNGAKWQKEQMMAKSIDAKVLENYDGKVITYDDRILDEKLSNCKVFDKVKMILVKEE